MDDERDEPYEFTSEERRDIEADLDDLGSMRTVFSTQGVKGGDRMSGLRREPLLRVGASPGITSSTCCTRESPGCTSPPTTSSRRSTSSGTTGRGYVDALADAGLEAGPAGIGHAVPVVRGALRRDPRSASRCGRSMGPARSVPGAHRERDGRARRPRATCPRGLRALLSACGTRLEQVGDAGPLAAGERDPSPASLDGFQFQDRHDLVVSTDGDVASAARPT